MIQELQNRIYDLEGKLRMSKTCSEELRSENERLWATLDQIVMVRLEPAHIYGQAVRMQKIAINATNK